MILYPCSARGGNCRNTEGRAGTALCLRRKKKGWPRCGLDHEQLAWRRWAIENNCGGDVELFRQEYPACPEEAFLSTGSCIFDKAALMARLQALEPPMRRVRFEYAEHGGLLTLVGAVDDKAGPVLIYRGPEPGKPYVLGGDTAGDGSDNFTGQVLDNYHGGQVAVLKQPFDEDEYARQMMCLGYFYNTALLGIEANFFHVPHQGMHAAGIPAAVRQRRDGQLHAGA